MAKHKHRQQNDEPALPQEEVLGFDDAENKHNAPVEEVVINAPVEEPAEEIAEEEAVDAGPVLSEPIPHLEQNGWFGIDTAPKTGERLKLSAEPDGEGELAYWRKTRGMKNINGFNRWLVSGKWTNPLTGLDILFVPRFWKYEK